ncbi:hypothetical protein KUCAC02_022266 [Chaenocephalus aceratus]|nr:hypothetical protein KUCAC02_022266 [Chaenocephalus aceratus]
MFGLKTAGVLGASVVMAGGVAYLVWNYASSPEEKETETRPEEDGKRPKMKGKYRRKLWLNKLLSPLLLRRLSLQKLRKHPSPSLWSQQGPRFWFWVWMEPGFNAVSISREDLHIEFLEIGGKAELRPYWQKYMSKALLLVFVVDSSNPELFPVAKKHLHELLTSEPRPRLPLMVLANKQDLPEACSITDLHDALSLSEAGDRRLFLIGTHVKKGEGELSSGVQDARELILQMVSDSR